MKAIHEMTTEEISQRINAILSDDGYRSQSAEYNALAQEMWNRGLFSDGTPLPKGDFAKLGDAVTDLKSSIYKALPQWLQRCMK